MGKFNTVKSTGVQSPVKTVGTTVNSAGKLAFTRDAKSELFLLAVANFVGTDTFYESAKNRDDRFSKLCAEVAVQDTAWFGKFVGWLRNDAFMRSAAVVAAVEGSKAVYAVRGQVNSDQSPRAIVAASMARADEPGEVLAYYESKYGKNFPAYLKKGVADGAKALYNEYSLLKYDTDSKGYRFADVIQLTHPSTKDLTQNTLFKYALDRRYGNVSMAPLELSMIAEREYIMSMPVDERKFFLGNGNAFKLKRAGMTWEALSGWLQGPMDAKAWEAIIPSMGYMALLRNLRNFQQAGVSKTVMNSVLAKLADPEQVAKSKQFPFRFLAAYQANKGNLQVSAALESALDASLSNVPSLKGKTLILVDRSGSMFTPNGGVSDLNRADSAALFGTALALRAENADLVQYGSAYWRNQASMKVDFRKGDSILPLLDKFENMGGTDTTLAIQTNLTDHDRIVLITDEQYNGWGSNPESAVPAKLPMYTWNLGGYREAHGTSGSKKRHTFGGLTDKGFQMIPLIEAGQTQKWPWEVK